MRETREERGGCRRARRTSLPPPDPFVSSPGGVYLVDTDALPSPDEVVDAPDAVAPAGDAGWAEPGEPDRDARDNTPPSDLV